MTYKISKSHSPNLPWRIQEWEGSATIVDATGLPVALGLPATSIISGDPMGPECTYNKSDAAKIIRAKIIVDAVNARHGAT